MSEDKVSLTLMNNVAYIWNSKDWLKVRENRIMGNFIGNLPALPRQDFFEGLPLALLPEETTLLLEKNLAHLITIPNLSDPPGELAEKCSAFRKDNFSAQVEQMRHLREKEIEQNIETIVAGKISKKRSSNPSTNEDYENQKQRILLEEFQKIQPPNKSCMAVQIFTRDPWISESDFKCGHWNYPSNDIDRLHYLIFKNLWERGYYITSGGKFGAHYLVYPDDPIKYHAHFLVICVEKSKQIDIHQIVSYGRLGQSVRKTLVLASLSNEEVTYHSIQWLGQYLVIIII